MKSVVLAVCAVLTMGVAEARAQMSMGSFHGYLTGHLGTVFGGDVSDGAVAGGVSVSMQETTGWGAEFDFARAVNVTSGALELDVNSYLINMSFIQPDKRIRAFATAGGGLMEVSGCASCGRDSKTYDLALSAGAGIFALYNDVIGMRADARYFWSNSEHPDLGRPENFKYWRLSVGVTYLWTVAP
jgi:hypothetical protein